jgi:hypothetical protein
MGSLKLFKRKECLVPTVLGFCIIALVAGSVAIFAFVNLSSFLTPRQPIAADVLTVEGWLPDYALMAVAKEFNDNKNYKVLIVTGGQLDIGSYLSTYGTYANIGAATLRHFGVDSSRIVITQAKIVAKDRTYAEAVAVRDWVEAAPYHISGINVFSFSCHTRRTHLLFKKAFKTVCPVGIMTMDPKDYDSGYWWTTSAGVRGVINETIAYLYAKVFFS